MFPGTLVILYILKAPPSFMAVFSRQRNRKEYRNIYIPYICIDTYLGGWKEKRVT